MGTFLYPDFKRLPLADRLSALPLLYSLVDFDNSDEAWRRYDKVTARELFKQFGVSERLFRDAFEPMLLVGLFAPAEQCSAAAAVGMLYYFILAHQSNFDVVWCRGTVGDLIFAPLIDAIKAAGGQFLTNQRLSDVLVDSNSAVTHVVCNGGDDIHDVDAVVFAVGVSAMQRIVASSPVLRSRKEFANLANLRAVDVLATRLWFDRKIPIPLPSNACFGFDATTGWTFFDLNALHDEFRDEPGQVIEADFYHADQLLALDDRQIIAKVQKDLTTCIGEFGPATVIDSAVVRLPRSVTHFSPGSYQHLLPLTTSLPNLFMSGDWVVTRHGSWSQEKAYVTGLEAANAVIAQLGVGKAASIIAVEGDEPHIRAMREVNATLRGIASALLPSVFLP